MTADERGAYVILEGREVLGLAVAGACDDTSFAEKASRHRGYLAILAVHLLDFARARFGRSRRCRGARLRSARSPHLEWRVDCGDLSEPVAQAGSPGACVLAASSGDEVPGWDFVSCPGEA